jgi:heat-inducible transcriptional repressor
MANLTNRQIQILKAIIEEYIETAEPVGSETLDKKYNLGISPATVRNEMVKLTREGFLKQPHASAGRSPTPLALRFYTHQLMKEKELSVTEEVAAKEAVWAYRQNFDKLLRQATRSLAEKTRAMALATDEEGDLYYAGAANILEMPEFFDIDLTKSLLSLMDRFDFWEELVSRTIEGEEPIHLLLGEELGAKYLEPCGFVYTHYQLPRHHGVVGIVGPYRLNYAYIIPVVRYFGNLIEELGQSW